MGRQRGDKSGCEGKENRKVVRGGGSRHGIVHARYFSSICRFLASSDQISIGIGASPIVYAAGFFLIIKAKLLAQQLGGWSG